ncbi:GerAB/ArcD/ProY family transporter [Schinkia sp. CFF1]
MKISGLQLFWITISFLTGNLLLLTMEPLAYFAKQDAWVSFILASLFGLLIVFIFTKVRLLYPKQNLIELSKSILGKWLGIIVIISYLIQLFTVLGNILGEFAVFTITILLPKTPTWILLLTILMLIIYLTFSSGIEGIARCSEVFGPIIIFLVIILTLFSIQNMDLKRILPVFVDNSPIAILKGSLYPFSIIGESVLLVILLTFTDHPKEGGKKIAWGLLLSTGIGTIVTMAVLLTLGPGLAAKLTYPFFDMVRYINLLNFVQNLEIVTVLAWILSVFIKLSVYFFMACYGTAGFCKIKDWRKLVWIVAPFSFILAYYFSKENLQGLTFLSNFWVPYILPINMVGIPILLWIVGSLRNKGKAKKHP